MKRIGIFGGTFDPFHNGHLSLAKAATEELDLDEVILLPNRVQPFKTDRDTAAAGDRLAMVNLVARDERLFKVSTEEIFGDEISYTYKTLCRIRERVGDGRLWFIMGADSLITLKCWYKGEDLLREFSFAAGLRPGSPIEMKKIEELRRDYDADIHIMANPVLDISSTGIKEKIRRGEDISALVPACVKDYIDEHGLYRQEN